MKTYILAIMMLLVRVIGAQAQQTYRGNYTNSELRLSASLNLNSKSIPIPGLELDSCYGYLRGNINGMWVILRVKKVDGDKATVRIVSERGSDATDMFLTFTDSTVVMKQDDVVIKGVKNNQYVKLPKNIVMNKE